MTPRKRRLNSDYEKLITEFKNHPYIKLEVEDNNGAVPERYFVTFKDVRGIKLEDGSTKEKKVLRYISQHKIEIYLHLDYPRVKPQCFLLTPIFHPNFRMASPHDICIGDFWAPGETLVDIIYQIGEMLQYKNYNVTSPLNGVAAKWAREHTKYFPTDQKDLRIGELDINIDNADKEEINIEFK
ncbi:MAG TPA: ubiquitin-conjugating enzyme E2 [Ignavibacteria bacterium]|nr:ubiquitin-conjugating enzyme E2 [Ignavibacteria bacterium]